MWLVLRRTVLPLLIAGVTQGALGAEAAQTDSEGASPLAGWTLGVVPYTLHFSRARVEHSFEPDVPHSYVWLVTAEKQVSQRDFAGLALFRNSFGQSSQYLYYGRRWEPFSGTPEFFVKLSGGVVHGYKAPFHKKIPFNRADGWGLTVIPAVGWQFSPQAAFQLNVLGSAGLMFQFNYTFK